jgi:hypothetical protein
MKFKPHTPTNTLFKPRRAFNDPVSPVKSNPAFNPIPAEHVQPADLTYDVAKILTPEKIASVHAAGKIVFHSVGDTGGVYGTDIQHALAVQMEGQITGADEKDAPAFFYHLGDVVYFNGLLKDYPEQFYEQYKSYPAPIFAIAGNHDGETTVEKNDPPDNEPSLTGFFDNFCTPQRTLPQGSSYRYTMDQPWPYWTLEAPFVTIIGLYSNIDGSLDERTTSEEEQEQYNWFVGQLKNADPDKCLILAVHHPPYSLDTVHGGYQDILDAIDQASTAAGRAPDAVFNGHVHCYQRYTRTLANGTECPYVIVGAGGYANTFKSMHKLANDPNTADKIIPTPFQTALADVVLANYNTSVPGFLRITVDATNLTGEYFVNTFDDNGVIPAAPFDTFTLNWKTHKLA